MNRPYVILTMMTSIDGKIEGDFIHDHNEELGDWSNAKARRHRCVG